MSLTLPLLNLPRTPDGTRNTGWKYCLTALLTQEAQNVIIHLVGTRILTVSMTG
jgi:hypothetical protein